LGLPGGHADRGVSGGSYGHLDYERLGDELAA